MEQKRTLCLLLQLPSPVKLWSKVSLVPGQISNLPPCWSPTQCQGLTLPGTVSPCSLQHDISPKPCSQSRSQPLPVLGTGERRRNRFALPWGCDSEHHKDRGLKRVAVLCLEWCRGLISITICLLCRGCFGVSKFRIVCLSCKCITVFWLLHGPVS